MSINVFIKYIIKEIINSVKTLPVVTMLMILCMVSSCVFMFFYFGYIHHMEQKKIDGESGENEFYVYFCDPLWPIEKKLEVVKENAVKKGELIELLMGLDERILDGMEVTLECKLISDVVDDAAIDNSTLSLATEFIIKDGKILPPRIEEILKKKNFLTEGRYFNDKDYIEGRHVCLPPVMESGNLRGEYEYLKDRYAMREDGSYIIDGKKYTPIGKLESFSTIPDIPVTTIRDDVFVKNISFLFDHIVTRYEYETISNDLRRRYGEQALVSTVEIKTADSKAFDRMVYLVFTALSMITAVITSFLYKYISDRRVNCIRVYGLCGMTLKDISFILGGKAMTMSLFSSIIGVLLYHNLLLPILMKSFEYLCDSAVMGVYITIIIIFMAVSYVFIKVSVLRRYH